LPRFKKFLSFGEDNDVDYYGLFKEFLQIFMM